MCQLEKLIQRIVRRPPQARFSDVEKLLEAFGWIRDRQKGSHVAFVKEGVHFINVPVHNDKVKRHYLDEICERLGLDTE